MILLITGTGAVYASLHFTVEAQRARLENEAASIGSAISNLVRNTYAHHEQLHINAFLPAIQLGSTFNCVRLTTNDNLVLDSPAHCSKVTDFSSDNQRFVAHPTDSMQLDLSRHRQTFYSQISRELAVYAASVLLLILVAGGSLMLGAIARHRDVITDTAATSELYQAIVDRFHRCRVNTRQERGLRSCERGSDSHFPSRET